MSEIQVVSASRVIHAPPEAIFELVADASRHSDFDGSGMVQGRRGQPEPLTLGSTFEMDMKLGPVPYRMRNTVVEFEPNRLITWRTRAPHRWKYELEPVDGGTRVIESFDWSNYPRGIRTLFERLGFPARNLTAIQDTLEQIAKLVEGDS